MTTVPVITIDGPSGSGKGTISLRLANALGWSMLDSGAVYRAVAWAVSHYQIDPNNEAAISNLLSTLKISLENHPHDRATMVICDGHEVTEAIRSEAVANMASQISALAIVRSALLDYQKSFRSPPGLVADGRDMGTIVFPDAILKFFLDASVSARASRRFRQLQDRGINVSLRHIQHDLYLRDQRDSSRAIAPTKPAVDAIIVDTTDLTVDQVFDVLLKHVKQRGVV